MFDPNAGKAGSLVTAALESAGVSIQGELLQWLQGAGQMLPAFLFLLAIVTGLIAFAAGGQFLWGRYLLVGPAVYFFMTQVTNPANLTQWQFDDQRFANSHIERALKESGLGQRQNVSMAFHLWNAFTSAITQELIGLLNLTQDGSHLDFMSKFQRYMNIWLFARIEDKDLERFVRLIMINECADYYMMQMAINNPHIASSEKEYYQEKLAKRAQEGVFELRGNVTREENEMHWWLVNATNPKFKPGTYTCQAIWEATVAAMRGVAEGQVVKFLTRDLGIGQTEAQTTEKWLRKIGVETNPATGQVNLGVARDNANAIQAINWVIARALWNELRNTQKYNEYYNKEGHSGFFAAGVPNGMFPIQSSGTNTSNAIRQVNVTETYQSKGELVNAALSMPYFQGLGLLLLAAGFPFFAMASILPGRAGAILTWAGLWAWLKLWDFGFAVVMMVDNILYAIFPRGPAITPGDMSNAGRVFMRLMTEDPSYSSRTYYNIIATCLFAVPIATGVFVKGGGMAAMSIISDGWKTFSHRLGLSSGTFSRAMQGQGYLQQQRQDDVFVGAKAWEDAEHHPQVQKDIQDFRAYALAAQLSKDGATLGEAGLARIFGGEKAKTMAPLMNQLGGGAHTYFNAKMEQKRAAIMTSMQAYTALKVYQNQSGRNGMFNAASATRSRQYSHDLAGSYPTMQLFVAGQANKYMNQENLYGSTLNSAVKFLFSGGGPSK